MPTIVDRAIALLAAIVLAIPAAIIALAIVLETGRPVLYRAQRVGRHGRRFTMLKFRTMRIDPVGSRITTADDPRVTRIGARLRRFRIDEWPQLWNVIVGDMALVGPRPEDPRFVDPANPLQQAVLRVRPGITGRAQLVFHEEAELLRGRDPEEAYRELVLPQKLRIDAGYAAEKSVRTDVAILVGTFRFLVSRDHDTEQPSA